MKILPISDIHTEFHKDKGKSFFDSLPDADVLILAGDIGNWDTVYPFVQWCQERYKNTIYILGNHEYYNATPDQMRMLEGGLIDDMAFPTGDKFFSYLNGHVTINNQRFVGTPLWYPEWERWKFYRGQVGDPQYITDFESVAFGGAKSSKALLEERVKEGDVVITHMLPSYKCVSPQYLGSPLNKFFVHEMDYLIYARTPKLWIHGHTHDRIDVVIGETRVFANPFGYPRENPTWEPVIIDV